MILKDGKLWLTFARWQKNKVVCRNNVFRLRFVLIATLFLGLVGCAPSEKKGVHPTIVEGKFETPPNGLIYLYSFNNLALQYAGVKVPIDSATVDGHGNFLFRIDLKTPFVFELRTRDQFLSPELFICPGNHLELSFQGSDNHLSVLTNTPEGRETDYILQLIHKFYTDKEVANTYYIGCNYMDGYGFSKYTQQRRREMLRFYLDYFKENAPDKIFDDFARAEIKYQDAAYRAKYIIKKRVKGHIVEADSAFFDFSKPEYLYDSTALNSASYYFFLNLYVLNLYGTKLDQGSFASIDKANLNPSKLKFDLAANYLPPESRKVVQSTIALNNLYPSSNQRLVNCSPDSLIARFIRTNYHEKDSLH